MLRIRELRKEQNVSQQKLAGFLGVTQAALSGWETGKYQIDNESLAKTADYFGVTTDYILRRTDMPHSPKPETPGRLRGPHLVFPDGTTELLTQEEAESIAVHLRVLREFRLQREQKNTSGLPFQN